MARRLVGTMMLVVGLVAVRAEADEIWVAPTTQSDLGGLGIGSNGFWPVTAFGAVRFAWGIPDNLHLFQSAKVVLIPHSPGGAATLYLVVCPARSGDPVLAAGCVGPFQHTFTGVANQLLEVDISTTLGPPLVMNPGQTSLALFAFTTPTTATDHIVGLRFAYAPAPPSGVATLEANTFSGTQIAPAFVGDGSGVTNVNANLLDGVDSTGFAPTAHGHDVSQILNAARLAGGNMFNGTQAVAMGNLDLDASTAVTGNISKNGSPFLHNFGSRNTFLGIAAGNLTMAGWDNTAVGEGALGSNTNGLANTAFGVRAMSQNTLGWDNTAIGHNALFFNVEGTGNTVVGAEAAVWNTAGYNNTAIGESALHENRGGSNNTALGFMAGSDTGSGSNNIYIAHRGVNAESNTIRIGQFSQTRAFIRGVRDVTTDNADAVPVMIDSAGQLGTVSSSRRYKEDIDDMADASKRLLDLRPVTFRYARAFGDGSKPVQFGLIAEEVAEVFPELVVRDAEGRPETVLYQNLSVMLLNELQRLYRELQRYGERIEALEQRRSSGR